MTHAQQQEMLKLRRHKTSAEPGQVLYNLSSVVFSLPLFHCIFSYKGGIEKTQQGNLQREVYLKENHCPVKDEGR